MLHQRCLADRVAVRSRSRILMIVVQWDSPERSCRWGSSALWLSDFCDLACNRPHQRGHGDGVAGRSGSQICMIWATVGFTRGVWATVGSAVVGLSSQGLSMSSGAHGLFSATLVLCKPIARDTASGFEEGKWPQDPQRPIEPEELRCRTGKWPGELQRCLAPPDCHRGREREREREMAQRQRHRHDHTD